MTLPRLSPEILRNIFVLCLPSNTTRKLQETDAPINLSRVCSTWYRIAVETPQLWSTIVLLPANETAPLLDRGTSHLRMCISRTKQIPVHLHLHVTFIAHLPSYTLICIISHYISTLSIIHTKAINRVGHNPPSYFPQDCFSTPNLSSLEVSIPETIMLSENDFLSFRSIVQSSPSLKRFGLDYAGPLEFGTIHTNWSILQELRFNSSTRIDLCCHILRNATSVRRASFGWVYSDPSADDTPEALIADIPPVDLTVPYTHPFLETLVIAHNDFDSLETIFRAFTLPNIQNLLLDYVDDVDDDWPQTIFLEFLQRSGCSLKQLGMVTEPLFPAQLIEVLESPAINNSLMSLLISNGSILPPFDDVVVKRLTYTPSEGDHRLCPRLQMINILRFDSLSVENLVTMLESRLDPNFQLSPSRDVLAPHSPKENHAYLKYLKICNQDSVCKFIRPLSSRGLLSIFEGTSGILPLGDQEKVLLRRYRSEGLVIWEYTSETEEWGPIPVF